MRPRCGLPGGQCPGPDVRGRDVKGVLRRLGGFCWALLAILLPRAEHLLSGPRASCVPGKPLALVMPARCCQTAAGRAPNAPSQGLPGAPAGDGCLLLPGLGSGPWKSVPKSLENPQSVAGEKGTVRSPGDPEAVTAQLIPSRPGPDGDRGSGSRGRRYFSLFHCLTVFPKPLAT